MTYNELTIEIQKLFIHHLELGNITIVDAAACLYILAEAKDENKLREYLDKLSKEFSIINELFIDERKEVKENLEEIVRNFVQKIVFDNPLLAAEISKKAMEKDMNTEKLKELYPDFSEYLKGYMESSME